MKATNHYYGKLNLKNVVLICTAELKNQLVKLLQTNTFQTVIQFINQKDKTCTIVAEGKSVAFIEFGTGVAHSAYGGELPVGVGEHGTYGKGNGKRDHWSYYGDPGNDANTVMYKDKGTLVITSGNEPAMAMWGAVEEMASQVEATWREVWNS